MDLVCVLLQAYVFAIFLRIILSWFSPQAGTATASVEGFLRTITDPVLEPVRRVMPRAGMLDLSPIVVLLAIQLVLRAIC